MLDNLYPNDVFLWGASTSSYQVEGGINNNDWNYFTSDESIKQRLYKITKPSIFYKGNTHRINLRNAGKACKFWEKNYYLQDFDLESGDECLQSKP